MSTYTGTFSGGSYPYIVTATSTVISFASLVGTVASATLTINWHVSKDPRAAAWKVRNNTPLGLGDHNWGPLTTSGYGTGWATYVNPDGSLRWTPGQHIFSDVVTLPSQAIADIAYAIAHSGTWRCTLTPDQGVVNFNAPALIAYGDTMILDSITLTADSGASVYGSFAKGWSADIYGGMTSVAIVKSDGSLTTRTNGTLVGALVDGTTGWTTPVTVESGNVSEANIGMHGQSGNVQAWYTYTDPSTTIKSTRTRLSTDTAGTWGSPTDFFKQTPSDSGDYRQYTQPYSPFTRGSVLNFTHSQNTGVPSSVYGGRGSRRFNQCFRGEDGRLIAFVYPSPVLSNFAGELYDGTGAPAEYNSPGSNIGQYVCTDGGKGQTWLYVDWTFSNAPNRYDMMLPCPYLYDQNQGWYAGFQKSYENIVGQPPVASAIVRDQMGVLYQLIYSTHYSRIVPISCVSPTPVSVPAITGATGEISNNHGSSAPAAATVAANNVTNHFSIPVPTDTNPPTGAKFVWGYIKQERDPITGVLDSSTNPSTVRFTIPSYPDIQPATVGFPDVYDGNAWLIAYAFFDVTITNANNVRFHIGEQAETNSDGTLYATTPQKHDYWPRNVDAAQGALIPASRSLEGSGTFNCEGRGYIPIQLSGRRLIDIDAARGSHVDFPVQVSGTYDSLTVNSLKLAIFNSASSVYHQLTVSDHATPVTAYTSVYSRQDAFWTTLQLDGQGELCSTAISGVTAHDTALLTAINSAAGSTYTFEQTWQQITSTGDNDYVDFIMPVDMPLLGQYAVLNYPTDSGTPANGDWFLVRSFDVGKTWEFAKNATPVTQLTSLRDWNRAHSSQLITPSLVCDTQGVYAIWVDDTGLPHAIGTTDHGEAWTGIPAATQTVAVTGHSSPTSGFWQIRLSGTAIANDSSTNGWNVVFLSGTNYAITVPSGATSSTGSAYEFRIVPSYSSSGGPTVYIADSGTFDVP